MNQYTTTKTHNSRCYIYEKQSGFSLIEVMVATLVLSVGILGVAGLQIVALKSVNQSFMKQQAMSVIQNLTERMRSNRQGVFAGNYVLTDSDSFDCSVASKPDCSTATTNCPSNDLATADLHNLVCGYKTANSLRTGGIRNIGANDISTFLGGKLSVSCTNTGDCRTGNVSIEVNWFERAIGREITSTGGAFGVADSLMINTRIAP